MESRVVQGPQGRGEARLTQPQDGERRGVVHFDVRPGAGAMADLSEALARLVPGGEWQTSGGSDGLARLEVALPTGTDLSPLLAELARRFRVERVTTSALSLHEIYVRAVRGSEDAATAPPATPETTHV